MHKLGVIASTHVLIAFVAIALLVIASAETSGQTPRFKEFAHLYEPTRLIQEQGLPPWSWPTPATFAVRFNRYEIDARPWRLLHARFSLYSGQNKCTWAGQAHFRAQDAGGTWAFRMIAGKEESGRALTGMGVLAAPQWYLKEGDWGGEKPLRFEADDGSTLNLSSVSVEAGLHLPADLWAEWVLVTTLLEMHAPENDPQVTSGHCSLDDRPVKQAMQYAEEAMREGRTGRFLRFRLRVAGDRFRRHIRSSYGQAAAGTQAAGLKAAPVDLDRFFLGLVISVTAERPAAFQISASRLGRAIAESGRSGPLVPRLRRLVADPSLDAWNRTRALAVLVYTLAHDPTRRPLSGDTSMTRTPRDVVEGLRKLPMPDAARAWLDLF